MRGPLVIRLLAPRCAHRANAPSFRALLCRAHPGQAWCGRLWTANGLRQLQEAAEGRQVHEALCETGVLDGIPAAPTPTPAPVFAGTTPRRPGPAAR